MWHKYTMIGWRTDSDWQTIALLFSISFLFFSWINVIYVWFDDWLLWRSLFMFYFVFEISFNLFICYYFYLKNNFIFNEFCRVFLFVLQTKHSIEFKRLIFPINFLLNSLSFLLVIEKKTTECSMTTTKKKQQKQKLFFFCSMCALVFCLDFLLFFLFVLVKSSSLRQLKYKLENIK